MTQYRIMPGKYLSLMLGLAVMAGPAFAADKPNQELAPYTAASGAPLDSVQAAMELPWLALGLTVDPRRQAISGQAEYHVRAAAPLDRLEFDLDPRLAISRITVAGQDVPAGRWNNIGGLLTIPLSAPLATGQEVAVTIAYAGKPRVAPRAPWDGGMVWSKTPDGQPWVASAVQGLGCDLFWPCLDHPTKRVTVMDLAIRVPEGLTAAANGRLVSSDSADGWTTWRWQARQPNDYGVSLQIAPYELAQASYPSRYGGTIPIAFWHLKGQAAQAARLNAEMADFLTFFESTIGPYPFADEKVGLVETPHLGMEHQTINAYGNGFKLAPEGYDWLMHHEFAHEWFANQLAGSRNADMWLAEGFGTYMQPLYLKWKSGDFAYRAALWELRKKVVSKVPLAPAQEIRSGYYNDTEAGWGADIYYKGAWVLHTLREYLGDEAFFTATRQLTYGRTDPRPGNFAPVVASTDDFRRIVEQVSQQDLGWFFDAYFLVPALPKLTSTRSGSTLNLGWETGVTAPFVLPVEVEIDGQVVTVPMPGGRGSVALPTPDAHVVLDPRWKILRDDPAISAWQAQERAKAKAAAAAAAAAKK